MKFLGDVDTSDLILLDVKYAKVKEGNKKVDYAMLLMKNVVSGKKMVFNIPEPEMEIYFTKPECRNYTHNKTHMDRDKTYSKTIKYKNMLFEIAKEAGPTYENFVKGCFERGQFKSAKNIHKYQYVYGSDIEIENYYRVMWNLHYHNPKAKPNITKQFLDIEVDILGYTGKGICKDGSCPINAVSITDAPSKTVYTFLLRNKDNPQIAEFEKNIDSFVDLCHETFDEYYGELKYQVFMFDSEIEMIQAIFSFINQMERDFCAIWNMGYDIQYFIRRIKNLGYEPRDIMCNKEFKAKQLYYFDDIHTYKRVEKKDYFDITSKTIFVDQMLGYGKIRKGRGELPSLRLNAIAKKELGDEKLDYSEDGNIKTFCYRNFMKFVLYNIKDTLLQYGIENRTNDIDNIYLRSVSNVSMYRAIFSQTKFLKNRFYLSVFKQGKILGNNINIDYDAVYGEKEDDGVKFDGAVVGDPMLNDFVGIDMYGKPSRHVHRDVVDMDFSSMYPNINITFNIYAHTMIGKLLIENKWYRGIGMNADEDLEDPSLKFEAGKEFVENILTQNIFKTGSNWFGLPSVESMIRSIDKKHPVKCIVRLRPEPLGIDEEFIIA